jgi:AcrR family transcriptional regulator
VSADAGSAGPTKATSATQAAQAVKATPGPLAAKAPPPPASPPTPPPPPPPTTSDRILDAALASFAARGYEATSLDALAKGLELTKQSILYWFPSKDAVLEATIARSATDLSRALESALQAAGPGWVRVEAVVRSVFRLAARQPELLGLLREVSRLGPPAATQMTLALEPLVQRASSFLEAEMDAGTMRRHDPRLLLLAIYSTVIGMVTEVEVMRALGEEPTARSLVRRRADVLNLLHSALVIPAAEQT